MNPKKILSVLSAIAFAFNIAPEALCGASFFADDGKYDINKHFSVGAVCGTGENLVALVQDLHCHYDTQIKISELLENISKQDNFNKIFVEGASRDITSSFIKTLPENIKKPLIDNLLKEGKLGGGERFYLNNASAVPLYALEDEDLYDQNAKRLEYIFGAQKEADKILSKMQRELKTFQRKHLSANSRKMLSAFRKYENQKLTQNEYYKYLIRKSKKQGINLNGYQKIVSAANLDTKINKNKLKKEIAAYLDKAKKELPYKAYKELSEGDIIKNIAKNHYPSQYKELDKYITLYKYENELNSLNLYEQEKNLFTEILIKSAGAEEIETLILSVAFAKFANVMKNKATDAEFRYVREFEIGNIREAWNRLSKTQSFAEILPYFYKYNEYYLANEKRNYEFADRIIKGIDKEKTLTLVLTGGFHTEDLKQILISKGLSALVLTPKINTGTVAAEKIYVKRFNEQAKGQVGQASLNAFALKAFVETGDGTELIKTLREITALHKDGAFGNQKIEEIISQITETYNNQENVEKIEKLEIQNAKDFSAVLTVKDKEIRIAIGEDGKTEASLNSLNPAEAPSSKDPDAYKKEDWYRELIFGKYQRYSGYNIEKIAYIISVLDVPLTENLISGSRSNKISFEELKNTIDAFEDKTWIKGLFDDEYPYQFNAAGIKKYHYLASALGLRKLPFNMFKFAAYYDEMSLEKFKEIVDKYKEDLWLVRVINVDSIEKDISEAKKEGVSEMFNRLKKYKNEKWFEHLFLGSFDTRPDVKRKIFNEKELEAIESAINAGIKIDSGNLIFYAENPNASIRHNPGYFVNNAFWGEEFFEKRIALSPLISALPQLAPAAEGGRNEYIFSAPNRTNTNLSEIERIFVYYTGQEGSGKQGFIDYNDQALRSINSVKDKAGLDAALSYVEKMMTIILLFDSDTASQCRQKYMEFNRKILDENYDEIREMLNTLINFVHRQGETAFFDVLEKSVLETDAERTSFRKDENRNLRFINLSENGKINYEILKVFRNLMDSYYGYQLDYKFDIGNAVLKDDIFFASIKLGHHSVSIKADFNENNREMSISFYEGEKDIGNENRIDYFTEVLERLGFSVSKESGYVLGLKAKLNKDTGLSEKDDLSYILEKTILLFNRSGNVDLFLGVYPDKADELVQRFFSEELREFGMTYDLYGYSLSTRDISRFSKPSFEIVIEKLNPVLEELGLEKITPDLKEEYERNAQEMIDGYFNDSLERAYAQGAIVLNESGRLVKKEKYDIEIEVIQELLGENSDKLFDAGAIINQIASPRRFKFREAAKFGGQNTLQTGFIQLETGEYLSVKAIVSKGKTIKAAKVELVNDSGRAPTDTAELIKLLNEEGYENLETETISKREQNSLINSLKQKIQTTDNPSAAAFVTSKGKSETFTGEIIADADRTEIKKIIESDPQRAKSLIWVTPYTTLDDFEIIDQIGAILTLGGGYTSHAAINARERKKPSMVLSAATLQKNKTVEIASVKPKGEIRNIDGIQAQTAQSVKITLKSGDKVLMDNNLSTIEILDDKTVISQPAIIEPAAEIKVQITKPAKKPLNKLNVSEIIKTFEDLKPEDKERNGIKGWNLAQMLQEAFKGENIIPNGITLDKNAIRYYAGKKALEFDRLEEEINDIIADNNLSYETKKNRIEPLRKAIKELIKESSVNGRQAKKLTDMVLKKMKKLGISEAAVRSSGVGEDGQTHAFAGMGETKTKVKRADVPKAIAEVFEAFYSDRAIDYMIKSAGLVQPAIAIQDWVDFTKSGFAILDGDILTINGAYGEGEGLASGAAPADTIKVKAIDFEKGIFEILEYETADKDYRVERSVLQKVTKGRKARIFNEAEIKEIVISVGKIKKDLKINNPDTEFGFNQKNAFKVVQARENTAASAEPKISQEEANPLIDGFISDKTRLNEEELLRLMEYAAQEKNDKLAADILAEMKIRASGADNAAAQRTFAKMARLAPASAQEKINIMPLESYGDMEIQRQIHLMLSAA
jgi:phosphoenolpyruvate synthase/pyruvate phosphate dikinase